MKRKAYRSVAVKEVRVEEVVGQLAEGAVFAGIDVSKESLMVVLMDTQQEILRPWKVEQPRQIPELTQRLKQISTQRKLIVALEPTGTYGDPLRQALGDAGLVVHRVGTKSSRDYAEIFDGVPSQHDGKDAAVVADLARIGKSEPWPLEAVSAQEGRMSSQVQWLDAHQGILQLWVGKLEGLLARFWPEVTTELDLKSATLLHVLAEYGGPAKLAADSQAEQKLAGWGRQLLKASKIQAVLTCARQTLGVRMTTADELTLKRCAAQVLAARNETGQTKRDLQLLALEHASVRRMAEAVGRVTACVLFVAVGDPRDYTCGAAYRKALGLNLKERSSGRYQGHLKITKRGPSQARRWLYMCALRHLQQGSARTWYERKKARDQGRGGKGVVAIMRKLALAVYAVTVRNEPFDSARLFPGRASRRPDPAVGSALCAQAVEPGGAAPRPPEFSASGRSRTETAETC